jgi:uncharacterized protein YodC (DUF2158 family)
MLNQKEINQLERQAIVVALFKLCDPHAMDELKPGDTVQLKSGGPIMTVRSIDRVEWITCDWFENNKAEHKQFNRAQLKKVDPDEYAIDA